MQTCPMRIDVNFCQRQATREREGKHGRNQSGSSPTYKFSQVSCLFFISGPPGCLQGVSSAHVRTSCFNAAPCSVALPRDPAGYHRFEAITLRVRLLGTASSANALPAGPVACFLYVVRIDVRIVLYDSCQTSCSSSNAPDTRATFASPQAQKPSALDSDDSWQNAVPRARCLRANREFSRHVARNNFFLEATDVTHRLSCPSEHRLVTPRSSTKPRST
ncbi:LAQU0S10e04214g1_1 [Lachancea quebecensis]|uniref:LAQU0S10e04214g1_1 n=1 Tax=Lachancea quebecensis TaxID=1654605 RepID=A0A0P1KV18_9SACH|nr:LAQU0S10e04214g1_1 [Lachancea quebecensis]